MSEFLFATGIENSYPVIAGGVRVDEMEKCGHYRHWEEDLDLVRETGLRYLRWGPALYKTFLAPGRYDWAWFDDVMDGLRRRDIEPVLDLCHFGVPDWLGDFQNADFPEYFAEYAAACARRYPHVRYWTPVNEILITTLFSAKYGWWNERLTTDQAFVRATRNACRANVLGMQAIRRHVPDAVFVQSESIEYTHPETPDVWAAAELANDRRFLPLDFVYGHPVSRRMREYLRENGLSDADYNWFMTQRRPAGCILGTDYYSLNEHLLRPDGSTCASGEVLGYYVLAKQYHERYRLPLMHTETNLKEEEGAVPWLHKQWRCLLRLRQEGVPVLGFTWYSLTDQMDWDTALREDARRVNAVGLYDLDRNPRPVGAAYRNLVGEWDAFLNAGAPHLLQAAA
jgi:beta-glucosidase/6-phospho-beta-glucosidase/beta-galactosidase